MKIKKILMLGILCLTFGFTAMADDGGESPGGNRSTPPPDPPSTIFQIVQIIVETVTNL